jgi:predicted AlkP superfamily pyrophosphatase or phosphodiesterase
VLDQFRQEYLTRYQKFFGRDGFNRLMREGANFTQAHYSHATTYTGPGHAQILSGSFGHTNGIIGNRWWNPQSKQVETMFYDANAKLPGIELSPKDDDTSPRNFIGDNVCDQLLISNHMKSKAIGIALKDRAAIMLAGKLGKAYWFHESVGQMVTSSYYGSTLPAWLQSFNARKIPDSYFGKAWTKSLPEAAYSISRVDDFPQETDLEGMGRAFPHVLSDKSGKPSPNFYTAFTATPFGVDYTLQLAREAIQNEGLGTDEYPDILGVSITPTDIAGHAFGPDSQEIEDMVARLDGQLAGFFKYLDSRFKPGEYTIALTADHGATPLPEYMSSLGIEAGRIKKKQLGDAIEAALTARFGSSGEQKWVRLLEDPSVFLNTELIASKKLNPAEVQQVAGEATLGVKGIAAFYTRAQIMNGQLPPNKWAQMIEKSFYAERSGDVLLVTKPYYFWGSYGEKDSGSTHGSPYEYDTHVPMIFYGAGVERGQYAQRVDITDIAPTLSNILGVNPPSGNEGRALHEVLKP